MMPETDATSVLKIRDDISLRYLKAGNGPPLVLLHTIRTQLEYFYCDKDWSRAAERQRTAAELDGARIVTLERTGHSPALSALAN